MSRSKSRRCKVELSPLVRRIIGLARHAENHDWSSSHDGEAAFLADAAVLAARHVGRQGFLAPHPELYLPIEDLANRHFDWADARRAFAKALERVGDRDVV